MKNTLKDITNICVLILIFLYIYALLGLEMYSLRVAMDDGQPPQSNFNSLYSAMVTVFIMLANDGWAKIYFVHYRVTDGLSTSVYFLSLIFIGRFIVMNLFVSILVENFEELSVRQDFVDKMHEINEVPLWQKVKDLLCLRTEIRVKSIENVDDMADEEVL